MLDQASWLPQAQSLQIGQKRYREHDCGPGRKLVVSRDTKGYNAWCFRCSDSGYAPGPQLTLAQRVEEARRARASDDAVRAAFELPAPRCYAMEEWPAGARMWLHKAGLGRPEVATLGAFFHGGTQRVVIPLLEDGEVVFWQARAYQEGRQPKYLSPPVDRSTLLPRYGHADRIVLTEDLLSAFKIGLVGEAWCLMGTHANPRLIAGLLHRQAPVAIWLDPDGPGKRAAAKVHKQLKAYGIEARVIRSGRDPKLHTFDHIKECIQ
jgi:DNA primase